MLARAIFSVLVFAVAVWPIKANAAVTMYCNFDDILKKPWVDLQMLMFSDTEFSEYVVFTFRDSGESHKELLTVKDPLAEDEFIGLYTSKEDPEHAMMISVTYDIVGTAEGKYPRYRSALIPMRALEEIVTGSCYMGDRPDVE